MQTRSPDLRANVLEATITRHAAAQGIPLPGSGGTLTRWQLFETIAATQGAVAIKLFEAHADALAILAELTRTTPERDTRWAVWAAEPPDAQIAARNVANADVLKLRASTGLEDAHALLLTGRKAWCSGADSVSHALVTCHNEDNQKVLAAIDVRGPGVTITDDGWHAVGMHDTYSCDVRMLDCPALQVGPPRAYLDRPGFWQGGAGIAACWYGTASPFYWAVRDIVRKRDDPHAAAHLGAIACELGSCAALLRDTAAWIDAHPHADAFVPAMHVRLTVEGAAQRIMQRAGNVLGAGPLCKDAALAARFADLPVFLRQSHAERDLATLGGAISRSDTSFNSTL